MSDPQMLTILVQQYAANPERLLGEREGYARPTRDLGLRRARRHVRLARLRARRRLRAAAAAATAMPGRVAP
ncbi:hypothetical protein [Demequina sp.]|uniref:hypothetical protein n=1 Tax=Demequina sp. TaxID=2050685 RepID=UPI003A8A6ED1